MTTEELQIQKAFGTGLYKNIYKGTDGVQRWLEEGDVVEFTDRQCTNINAEFTINRNSYWKIWFSQFQGYFCSPTICEIYEGDITMKNGDCYRLNDIDDNKFWNLVKGKKFKVEVDSNFTSRVNGDVEKLKNHPEVFQTILSLIYNKQWDELVGVLKAARLYSLVEV